MQTENLHNIWRNNYNKVQSRFFKFAREMKIWLKNQIVREIRGKIIVFDWGEGNNFWFKLQEIMIPLAS